jgi:hypothetical protein
MHDVLEYSTEKNGNFEIRWNFNPMPSAVSHACNPSYLGSWDWEDGGLRLAWANSSWDPIFKNNQNKMD